MDLLVLQAKQKMDKMFGRKPNIFAGRVAGFTGRLRVLLLLLSIYEFLTRIVSSVLIRLLSMRVLPSLRNTYNGNLWQLAARGYPHHCDR